MFVLRLLTRRLVSPTPLRRIRLQHAERVHPCISVLRQRRAIILAVKVTEESTNPRGKEEFVKKLEEVHANLKDNLRRAREKYKKSYDRHAKPAPQVQCRVGV